MGGFNMASGVPRPSLLEAFVPDEQDLKQFVRCQDEFIQGISKKDGLNPQSIKLLLPAWRICSSFHDLQHETDSCIGRIWSLGKPYIDLIEKGNRFPGCITLFVQKIRISRDTTLAKSVRAELNHLKYDLMPRIRRLVNKVDKLYDKVLMDSKLVVKYPNLYEASPYFNAEIAQEDYHSFLLQVRNDIVTYWNELKLYTDLGVEERKCSGLLDSASWPRIICGAILAVGLVTVISTSFWNRQWNPPKDTVYDCLAS